MAYRKQCILCAIISCLIMSSTFISFTYCIGRRIAAKDVPYGLSENYIKLVRENRCEKSVEEIIDLENDTNVTIISEYSNENYIALYDPRYYFYNENPVQSIGERRYFSKKDYLEHTKTGAAVAWSESQLFGGNIQQMTQRGICEECIFLIDTSSKLYQSGIDYIVNMTSVEKMGETIYIDSDDTEKLQKIEHRLVSEGYKVAEKKQNTWIKIEDIIPQSLYEIVVFMANAALYPIYAFACGMMFFYNRRILKINKLCGGTGWKIFCHLSERYFKVNIIGSAIMTLVCHVFIKNAIPSYVGIWSTVCLYLGHVLVTGFLFWFSYICNMQVLEIRGTKAYVK